MQNPGTVRDLLLHAWIAPCSELELSAYLDRIIVDSFRLSVPTAQCYLELQLSASTHFPERSSKALE
jgi:hypothetical protein